MRWVVGLDLRARSEGAVRFTRWLTARSRAPAGERPVYVHVLEEEHLRHALKVHHLDAVTAAARAAAERILASAGAEGEVRIVQGLGAEDALEQARAAAGADALVVGRAAGREGAAIVRLGRVARRLLRRLASPVAVVPPDLRDEDLGDGPVVALSSLAPDSAPACRFAAALAGELGRPFAICHVARADVLPYLPPEAVDLAGRRAAGEAELARWTAAEGLRPERTAVLVGSVVDRALEWAEGERAPLVVAGSRHLGARERLFQASVGTSLAATAPIPIMVVPSST